jgi:hypothetical protein
MGRPEMVVNDGAAFGSATASSTAFFMRSSPERF